MNRRVSPTLEIRNIGDAPMICCCNCGYALASPGNSWKESASISEVPTDQVSCVIDETSAGTILRLFSCRKCGALLDTETAVPDDPYLEDAVEP
jgi:acetone carboxylase gamma subunit